VRFCWDAAVLASSAPSTAAALGGEPAQPLWQQIYTAACGLLLLGCAATITPLVVADWQERDARYESPLALVTMAAASDCRLHDRNEGARVESSEDLTDHQVG
jgi:hypothetical protein